MKITVLTSLILVLLAVHSFAQNTTLSNRSLADKNFATRVLSGDWAANGDNRETDIAVHGGLYIRFTGDGKYKGILGPGQGGEKRIDGMYQISAGKLTLNYMNRPWLKNGTLKFNASDLKYPYSLTFENTISSAAGEILSPGFSLDWNNRLIDLSTKAKENASTRIDGVASITAGCIQGTAAETVNLRKKPSASAERYEFVMDPMSGEKTKALKKNTSVIVLAKTPGRDRVGRWENHWYYIEFKDTEGVDHRAWAFGEFIRMSGK